MLKKLFSTEAKPGAFFRRIDWTAFWGATAISLLVYFFTLGPSVGLEDSGELTTAADHLGVPHPPGYPFWTLCCWIFCRVFSWVTYMGQPTPAWAVSLFSAVAGAFAAGCTAMLICRSGSDMLDSMNSDAQERVSPADTARRHALMSFAGGLGGALLFAFSPVEWSQSTIVEIYSLNALFLMAVFLLSYRWMRQPSHKILWLTAFVFGLGLTNYQVLLMAALPLAVIIFFKDIRLFRDFTLILIPVGLTAQVLQIGSKLRASAGMGADVINKFAPLVSSPGNPNELAVPNSFLLWTAFALIIAAPVVGMALAARKQPQKTVLQATLGTGLGGVFFILLAIVFAGKTSWSIADAFNVNFVMESAPLIKPVQYAWTALFLSAACVLSLGAVFAPDDAPISDIRVWRWLAGAGACALVALLITAELPTADSAGYRGVPFSWTKPLLVHLLGLALLVGLSILTPRKRGLAFAIPVASVQLVVFILLYKGAMNGLTHPKTWWFFWPCIWNFIMLGLATFALPNGRAIGIAMLFAELGVSFYVYMPIVSDFNPPMNWGYPRTWDGFKHAIMRGQYEAIKMPELFSAEGFSHFCKQMGFYFKDLRMQFTLVAAALALIPFALWKGLVKTKEKVVAVPAARIAVALYAITAALVIVFSELFEKWTDGEVPGRLDKYLLFAMAILALVGVGAIFVRQTLEVVRQLRGKELQVGANARVRVHFLADDVSQQWLIAVGSCFAIMSFVLVALAGFKGDIQDGVIQKVKFIASHCMFSLWIGYGLIVGLVVANRLVARFVSNVRARRVLFGVLCACAACTAVIPVYENYTNDRLVFEMGCAEQNGHTFGWQFGNYQLRGANAIREELSPDEEPLPNPLWPEEMGTNALFFGGTDPGRFVPTYMIYSANVRPDVKLITQNALADDTYMSVERDLYGDDIWIPSKDDSAAAFTEYVNSMSPEERAAKGVTTENGRVQVTGALSVMDINGILTKMMFDHERRRRAFYVEESYVIRWMYDYMTPHGLIMKINDIQETTNGTGNIALRPDIVRNDLDFWDWYTRRLLKDPAFRRDFAAQKSFSKLRAAISGLYANARNKNNFYPRSQEAENEKRKADWLYYHNAAAQSFREAYSLYPVSPESSMRYITEYLCVIGQWDAILDILEYTKRQDPNSTRTGEFLGNALRARDAVATFKAIIGKHGVPVEMKDEGFRPPEYDLFCRNDFDASKFPRDDQEALVDARLDYSEALLNFFKYAQSGSSAVPNRYVMIDALETISQSTQLAQSQTGDALKSSFSRLWRSAKILSSLNRPHEAAESILAALEFPEANTYEVLQESVRIFAAVPQRKKECVWAIDRTMEFPESQHFDTLVQFASILQGFGEKGKAIKAMKRALPLASTAQPPSVIRAARIVLLFNREKNTPTVQNLLRPLLSRKNFSWTAEALVEYALVSYEAQMPEDAYAAFANARRINPESVNAMFKSQPQLEAFWQKLEKELQRNQQQPGGNVRK